MVMPLIARAVGCAPCHMHHVLHLLPVPWSCTSLPTPFIAHTLHHLHPSLPTPFISHTLRCPCCVLRHLLPVLCVVPITCAVVVHLVTRTMCCAPCCARHVLHPSPMLWSCTSSHAPCVTPPIACAMCCAPC